jgi:hypothetical protein
MLDRNLGLEIVAIHPDSGGILSCPIKTTAKNRIIVITGLDPAIHLPLKMPIVEVGWIRGSSPRMTSGG